MVHPLNVKKPGNWLTRLPLVGGFFEATGEVVVLTGKTLHRGWNWGIAQSEQNLLSDSLDVEWGQKLVKNNKNLDKAGLEVVKDANRTFNHSARELGFAKKTLGSTIHTMFIRMGDSIGLDTSKWVSSKVKDDAGKALQKALDTKGNLFERIVSKPFRVAAHHPRVALAAVAAGAVAFIGNAMNGGAARRTQDEAAVDLMRAQQPVVNAQANTYQITPEDYAAMQARMRGGIGPTTGHGERVLAAKQAASEPPTPAADLAAL